MATAKEKGEQAPAVNAIPEVPATDSAAGVMEEILEQTILDVLNNITPDRLIGADSTQEMPKGTARPASAWVHGPGHLELLAMADERLTRVENMKRAVEGQETQAEANQVDKVIAKLVPNTKFLILSPAPASDMTAVPVVRYKGGSSAWINVFRLLKQANLTVDSGYRELYEVNYVPKTSPLWPALLINLGSRKDRRQEPKRGKKQEAGE